MPTENKCSILASEAGGCSDHLGREIYKILLETTYRGYVCREGYEITYRMTYRVPKLERYWPQGTISAVIFFFFFFLNSILKKIARMQKARLRARNK